MSVSRRSALRAAAWTAPAVAFAATAPAYATSNPSSEPSPKPVCEVSGWRTNHGHKGHDKPRPGTHHFHLTVVCGVGATSSTVRAVWIAGVEASHVDGVWTALNIRGGVNQWVRVLTDDGLMPDREVRFQPTRPEGDDQ